MSKKSKTKPKRGRPDEGRIPCQIHVLPETKDKIDSFIIPDDRNLNSRGKVIDSKFLSVN